jgi:periplasmic protein TonB
MAPSTHLEAPPELEVRKIKSEATLVLEERKAPEAQKPPVPVLRRRPEEGSFQSSMLEYNRMKGSRTWVDFLISLSVNVAILAVPVFLGLYFTDSINLKQLQSTFLAAPPPPPPPPPAPAEAIVRAAPPRRVFEQSGKLIAPTVVPKNIADIKEAPMAPDVDGAGVPGGVPGGVAGGSMGGVIGGVIGGVNSSIAAPIAPRDNKPRAPIRVGGRVREPRIIHRVEPTYPPLARQTHMSGVVILDAILDEQGNVAEMKIVSGPPLLIQAAMVAVKQWKYEPTYLNDQPVAVQLNVTVTFVLN